MLRSLASWTKSVVEGSAWKLNPPFLSHLLASKKGMLPNVLVFPGLRSCHHCQLGYAWCLLIKDSCSGLAVCGTYLESNVKNSCSFLTFNGGR